MFLETHRLLLFVFNTITFIYIPPQCNHTIGLKAFFEQILQEPKKMGLIGAGCSPASEPIADIIHYYNITQVYYTVKHTLK